MNDPVAQEVLRETACALSRYRRVANVFRERFVMVVAEVDGLEAYADESGTHDETGVHPGARVAVVAGYITLKSRWDNIFAPAWIEAVCEEGLGDEFGVAEYMRDRIRCWEHKQAFIRKLISIIRSTVDCGIGGGVGVKEYAQLLPEFLKDEVEHPYHFAYQLYLGRALLTLNGHMEPPLAAEDKVALVFHDQTEFRHTALRVYDQYRVEQDKVERFGSITFGDAKRYVPLQAADLLAYYFRRVLVNRIEGKKLFLPGSLEEMLFADGNFFTAYYDEAPMKLMIEDYLRKRLKRLGLYHS